MAVTGATLAQGCNTTGNQSGQTIRGRAQRTGLHQQSLEVKGQLIGDNITLQNTLEVHGNTTMNHSHLETTTIHGNTPLNNSSVLSPLTTHGLWQVIKTHLSPDVEAHDELTLNNSQFEQNVATHGTLNWLKSSIKGNLNVSAQKINFIDCQFKNLTMTNKDFGWFGLHKKNSIVNLTIPSGQTTNANITFVGHPGVANVKGSDQYTGHIPNGIKQ